MKLVERLTLEPRRSLYLVEVDGKAMLVGASERGVELLPWNGAAPRGVQGAQEAEP
jgi:flagellar biogenesis protein FliO